tara:strand:- start:105 stop:614 length:510 start_codon:yes stop_codon:yes gene_type:complete
MKNINKIFDSICNTLLALGLGISFTLHGVGKFPLPPTRMVDWFAGMGYKNPEAVTSLVAIGEVAAGVGIIIGGLLYLLNLKVKEKEFFIVGDIVTRLSALGVVIIMIGAIYIAHSDWFEPCQIGDSASRLNDFLGHIKFCPTKKFFMSEQIFLLLLGFYFTLKGNNKSF